MLVFFVNPKREIGSRFTGDPMNKFDTEFWNGVLKALLLAKREISELSCEACPERKCGAKDLISFLARKVESIHSRDLEVAIQSTP